jgi:hypothetical protein
LPRREAKQSKRLMTAAFEKAGFAIVAEKVCGDISQAARVNKAEYGRRGGDVASGLRNLSREFPRIYCATKEEMVERFLALNNLALRWEYIDEFSRGFETYTEGSNISEEDRNARRARIKEQELKAASTLKDTAKYVGEIAKNSGVIVGVAADE